MTSILHVSDTHLGKKQYGSQLRVDDFSDAFDTTIDIAIEEGVDAVIHTGDLFDDRTPNTKEISDAFSSIKRLEEKGIPFLGIVGNHERKWDSQWLDIFQTLDNVYRLSRDAYIIDDNIAVYGFDSMRDSEWEDEDFTINAPDSDSVITCVCMHELFNEIVPPMKADRSAKTVLENINIKPDIMPLGDYHSNSGTEIDGVRLFYAGATERTSATTEDPTVRMIRVNDGSVSTEWRKIGNVRDGIPRPFYNVEITLTDSSNMEDVRERVTEDVKESDIKDSVVVVNILGSSQSSVSSNDVYEILERLDVPVPYVNDKRNPELMQFNSSSDATNPTSVDIENRISGEIDDLDVSDDVHNIESQIVRNTTFNKSDIRDRVSQIFQGDDI